MKYLRSPEIDAPLEELSFFLPESCAEAEASDTNKIYVIDTSELFAALEGDSGGQKRSLERVCRLLQIKSEFTQHLHNAGNDARVRADCLLILPSPSLLTVVTVHTSGPQGNGWWGPARHAKGGTMARGLRVRFSKEDEDSDALPSDEDDDELTAGPYDPRTGRLREGWAERVARLQERLDGIRDEQEKPSGNGNGQPAEATVSTQENR